MCKNRLAFTLLSLITYQPFILYSYRLSPHRFYSFYILTNFFTKFYFHIIFFYPSPLFFAFTYQNNESVSTLSFYFKNEHLDNLNNGSLTPGSEKKKSHECFVILRSMVANWFIKKKTSKVWYDKKIKKNSFWKNWIYYLT